MFNKGRYLTRGINEEVDIRIQLAVWTLIDILNNDTDIEVDYLQIFKVRKDGNFVRIQHEQECPKYKSIHMIDADDIQIDGQIKIYVIDSGEYATMLFPNEY
ncbi:hypothetical protein JW813_06810 [Clostridium botulinum]|uniref:DUF960 family protein n=1 Tax=Clostridium botulinum TaxID=1491 RepID=UPI0022471E70|nr:DUF960 family protein [Clostridium botulinum]UZP04715.1 hypothetical protein JW813_06810 [Clostridium botulinum]UZP08127.1 hypothetical protein JYA71_07085 [Clostridium botulinum]UZP11454.1 hypothetical protein JYA74_06805 [Clostridium botulinum]